MKVAVAICVYNRLENVKLWVKCWKQCDTGAELVIIHNHYQDAVLRDQFSAYCFANKIKYIPRTGQGFDIGAMKDVFTGAIKLEYDILLWCCDDTIPMSKTFVQQFEAAMKPGIGIACMQISKSVSPHVRTTGFMIRRQVAEKIRFPLSITTKQDCYFFEHRGGKETLTEQVRAMGQDCVMVSDVKSSPLWDSFHPNARLRINRQDEFNATWGIPPKDKVLFICPVYNMFPQIISSLICQTHKNWELLLIHNGPLNGFKYDIPEDPRIKFIVHPVATGKWGHPIRRWALKEVKERRFEGDYIVVQNADNYLTPRYTEYLLAGFKQLPSAIATYCSDTVHSYINWKVLPGKLQKGFLDCGAVMVKADVAASVGWNSEEHSSDWNYFEDIAKQYQWSNFVKVTGALFVHN